MSCPVHNNARASFEHALELPYPMLQQKVGADLFQQLAYYYRIAHPSRTGDLHDVGRHFPEFVGTHLAGTPYAWLRDLASLEWAVADAGVAADGMNVGVESLAALSEADCEFAVLVLASSLRLLHSDVPVLSIWRAGQPDGDCRAIELEGGIEFIQVHRDSNGVALRALDSREFAFVAALAAGSMLGTAGEIVLPLLLIAGLLARYAALGLFAVNALAVVSYAHVLHSTGFEAALGQRYLWGLMLLVLAVFGPGRLSADDMARPQPKLGAGRTANGASSDP